MYVCASKASDCTLYIRSFRILYGTGHGYNDQFDLQQFGFYGLDGALYVTRQGPRHYDRQQFESNTPGVLGWGLDASRNSAVYGASSTVHPESLRAYCLIRY